MASAYRDYNGAGRIRPDHMRQACRRGCVSNMELCTMRAERAGRRGFSTGRSRVVFGTFESYD